jgi:hypothetical protein
MNIDDFLDDLSGLRFPHTFNPYSEKCAVHDVDDAADIRRKNLEAILLAATANGTRCGNPSKMVVSTGRPRSWAPCTV